MTDVGIDDDFIRRVRDEVTPGTSALFVMSANVVADRVLGEFKGTGAHLATSNLSTEQESRLREVFAEDEAQTPAGYGTQPPRAARERRQRRDWQPEAAAFHPVRRGRHLVRRDRAHCSPRTRTRPGPVTSARARRRADPLGRVGRGLRRPGGSPRSTRPARGLAEPVVRTAADGPFPVLRVRGRPESSARSWPEGRRPR